MGIRDKFGKTTNLAVTESDHHDKHQNSQWCFVAVGNDAKLLDKMLTQIENYANSDVDAVICNVQRFALWTKQPGAKLGRQLILPWLYLV